MTLYYSLVFVLLMTEMGLFMGLVLPMPHSWKRKLFTFISESPLVAKAQYAMKITFIFILILFIDSVNRVYRVTIETSQVQNASGGAAAAMIGHERTEVQARKFYSQRNMYLCGFTLFLSLILNRTYLMILDQLRLEEKVRRLEGDPKAGGKDGKKLEDASSGQMNEIGRLKRELEKRDRDIATLKKQTEGLQKEYNNMGDRVKLSDHTFVGNKKDS